MSKTFVFAILILTAVMSSNAWADYLYEVKSTDYIYNPGAVVPRGFFGETTGAYESSDALIGCKSGIASNLPKGVVCGFAGETLQYTLPPVPPFVFPDGSVTYGSSRLEAVIAKHVNSSISHVSFKLDISKNGLEQNVPAGKYPGRRHARVMLEYGGIGMTGGGEPVLGGNQYFDTATSNFVEFNFPKAQGPLGIDVKIYVLVYSDNLVTPDATTISISSIKFSDDSTFDLALSNPVFEQPIGIPAKLNASGQPILIPGEVAYINVAAFAKNIPEDTDAHFLKFYNGTTVEFIPLSLLINGPVRVPLSFAPTSSSSPQVITVSVTSPFPNLEPNKANNTITRPFVTQPATKIEITDVKIGQVLWDPNSYGSQDVTLVAGKSFAPRLKLKASGFTPTSKGSLVATMTIDGVEKISQKPILASSLESGSADIVFADLATVLPVSQVGSKKITLGLKPSADLVLSTAPLTFEKLVNVVTTQTLTIGLISVIPDPEKANWYVPPKKLSKFLSLATYLPSYMPVPDNGITAVDAKTSFTGDTDLTNVSLADRVISRGIINDLARVSDIKRNRKIDPFSKGAGIVSRDYFLKHTNDPDMGGIGIFHGAMLVDETTTALIGHELLHTLVDNSLVRCVEDYRCSSIPVVEGYDAKDEYIKSSDGKSGITGAFDQAVTSIMAGDYGFDSVWIDRVRYGIVLRELQKKLVDPRILIVTGRLDRDGNFATLNTTIRESGFIDESDGTDLQVKTVLTDGTIANQLSLRTDFRIVAESSSQGAPDDDTVIEVREIPISFAIPFESGVEAVGISLSGKKTTMVEPYGLSLAQAVSSIPNVAFKILPAISKAALKVELKQVQTALLKRRNTEALLILLLMRNEIKLNTREFAVDNGGFSRADILSMIDSTTTSLRNRIQAGRK